MNLTFTAKPMSKPDDLSLKASLAWDYYKINSGGWQAAEVNDGAVLVSDESGDLNGCSLAWVEPSVDDFILWLEEDVEQKLAEDPADYFRACGVVSDALLSDTVVQALLATINDSANAPAIPYEEPSVSAEEKPESHAPLFSEPQVQDYYVTFAIDGRCTVKVEASGIEEAKREAVLDFEEIDFGEHFEFVDHKLTIVENNNGNIVWETA